VIANTYFIFVILLLLCYENYTRFDYNIFFTIMLSTKMIIVYIRPLNRVCQVESNYRNKNGFLIVIVSFDILSSRFNFVNILFIISRDFHRFEFTNIYVYNMLPTDEVVV